MTADRDGSVHESTISEYERRNWLRDLRRASGCNHRFLVARNSNEGAPVAAEDPDDELTAEDYTLLLQQHAALPRHERVIDGIRLGPDVERTGATCGPDAPPLVVDAEDSYGTALDARPRYLPAGAEPANEPGITVVSCGGQVASIETWYYVAPNPDDGQRGGSIQIFRFRGGNDFALDEPSDRLRGAAVRGRPAVLSPPILVDGFGPSALVIDEEFGLTVIRADGQTEAELLRIAESLGGQR